MTVGFTTTIARFNINNTGVLIISDYYLSFEKHKTTLQPWPTMKWVLTQAIFAHVFLSK